MSGYKKMIANAFSRSALQYDQAANVQQQSGHKLLSVMGQMIDPQKNITIADVGCGTGFFTRKIIETYQPKRYIGIDLAEGMLAVAKHNNHELSCAEWLSGDAENLLLDNHSVDIIFANFSLQWCEDLPALMQSFYRVLAPKGLCCFTSLDPDTLKELRQSWQAVDQSPHVNHFCHRNQWQEAIVNNGFCVAHAYHETLTEYFNTVPDVMRSLKEVGANVITAEHRQGLTGKQRFHQWINAYEKQRTPRGIPASYVVDGWIIRKQEAR